MKQAVCGYGRAEKAQVQRMVMAILGLTKRADAAPRRGCARRGDLPRAGARRCSRGDAPSVIARAARDARRGARGERLVLDVGGVGYSLAVTPTALARWPSAGER